MKNKIYLFGCLMAAILSITGYTKEVYAMDGQIEEPMEQSIEEENGQQISNEEQQVSEAENAVLMEEEAAFSQDGNVITRDLLYDKSTNKQFITVETRDGTVFYLIIDYDKPIDEDGEQYQTYFLNQVDEQDLADVLETEESESEPLVCSCTEHCETGDINTECELCMVDKSQCVGKKKAEVISEDMIQTSQTETKEIQEKTQDKQPVIVLVLLLILLGGGAVFGYQKLKKGKTKAKIPADLEAYDFEEEEMEDTEEDDDDGDGDDDGEDQVGDQEEAEGEEAKDEEAKDKQWKGKKSKL